MVNDRKMDLSQAISNKFKEVSRSAHGVIKVRGLVTIIIEHLGFDIHYLSF